MGVCLFGVYLFQPAPCCLKVDSPTGPRHALPAFDFACTTAGLSLFSPQRIGFPSHSTARAGRAKVVWDESETDGEFPEKSERDHALSPARLVLITSMSVARSPDRPVLHRRC